jgi:hypothetical protein
MNEESALRQLLLLISMIASPVTATSPRDIPLGEQADRADIVVTAEASRLETCEPARFRNNCIRFRNVNIIRDNAHRVVPDEIVVNIDVGIDEQLFRCCSVGATYLMFLRERSSGYAPFFGGASFRLLHSVGGAARFKAVKAH